VVEQLTHIAADAAGDPTLAIRTIATSTPSPSSPEDFARISENQVAATPPNRIQLP
jgi:hypothetical protein